MARANYTNLGEIARLRASENGVSCVVVTLVYETTENRVWVDFRTHLDTPNYKGPTKRGFRIPLAEIDDLATAVHNVQEAVKDLADDMAKEYESVG